MQINPNFGFWTSNLIFSSAKDLNASGLLSKLMTPLRPQTETKRPPTLFQPVTPKQFSQSVFCLFGLFLVVVVFFVLFGLFFIGFLFVVFCWFLVAVSFGGGVLLLFFWFVCCWFSLFFGCFWLFCLCFFCLFCCFWLLCLVFLGVFCLFFGGFLCFCCGCCFCGFPSKKCMDVCKFFPLRLFLAGKNQPQWSKKSCSRWGTKFSIEKNIIGGSAGSCCCPIRLGGSTPVSTRMQNGPPKKYIASCVSFHLSHLSRSRIFTNCRKAKTVLHFSLSGNPHPCWQGEMPLQNSTHN